MEYEQSEIPSFSTEKNKVLDAILSTSSILLKGDDVQKLSIVQNLPQLYQFEPNATINRILPKIQQELPGSSSEFNIATARIFQILIQKKVPINLLSSILQGIDSRDPLVATTWIETLLEVINYLSDTQIRNDVLKWAVQKSAPSKPTLYRVASCHLLGRCAVHPKIQSIEVKTTILPLVQGLAQDVSFEVRACMAGQLANIAQGLNDSNLIKTSLLPSVVELAKDTNSVVRSSTIVAIAQLLQHFSTDTEQDVIIPLFKELCNQAAEENEASYPVLAREFGKYMTGLQNVLSQADCLWFLKFFKILSTKGLGSSQGDNVDPTQGVYCRHFCAQNLPSITQFTLLRASNSMDVWYSVFRDLAADPCYIVRKSVGACLHEVVGILGIQCRIIKPDIVRLLRDDAEDVLYMVVPKLGVTMETLCNYGLLSRETSTQTSLEIGRAILKCHMELSKGVNWRIQTDLLAQLEHLPNCLPSDFIHQHFTPVIFAIIGDQKAKPVKAQAARLLLVFLRYNIKEIQRKWIRENLMNRLYLSSSCYTRHIFIKMCESALSIFSKKYFKDHFFQPLLYLLDDRVSNIRLCTIQLLPQMRAMLGPEDKALLQTFDNMVKKLELTERDKDVIYTLRCVLKIMQSHQFDGNKQDLIQEEKQRQEDEAKIAQGKIVENFKLMEGLPFAPKRPVTEGTKAFKNSLTFPSQSKLSFLEQHFYTDAGISLPIKDIPPPVLTEDVVDPKMFVTFEDRLFLDMFRDGTPQLCGNLSSSELPAAVRNVDLDKILDKEIFELTTANITDDIKVNLTKLNELQIHEDPSKNKENLLSKRSHSKIPISKNNRRSRNLSCEELCVANSVVMRKYSDTDLGFFSAKSHSRIRPKSEILRSGNYDIEALGDSFPRRNIMSKGLSTENLGRIRTEIPILKRNFEVTKSLEEIGPKNREFLISTTTNLKESKLPKKM
ncbi:serine/threonine-protein phosphatase 4 regulatory subunit 4-like isoform X2 [Coccinella septempunctata]|uniref:serine/threonine-protein phosphatase 4 regulatory subunit 4-like isoform X2 n=1 Tax=Coccinella septempunctata TaxID=41139 RepID=UPI001D0786E6|nr:serine/threonine-protein phosphatase 4 regulatory subunit 4-like isoform X2 [Coccinella septempunctata]XP_044766934.1 serine/threonine-protein phosphatase 4 regulatory subunit 4-like isoform X2 [Coccinella septempunctata]